MGTSAAERETCPCLRTDYGHIVPGVKTPWNAMLTTTSTLYSIQRATDGGCRRSAGPKGLGIGRVVLRFTISHHTATAGT